jgi:hypothetical protein
MAEEAADHSGLRLAFFWFNFAAACEEASAILGERLTVSCDLLFVPLGIGHIREEPLAMTQCAE